MADITKCKGKECPLKETCKRYLAIANKFYQSYFTEIPYNVKEKKCDMYWKTN